MLVEINLVFFVFTIYFFYYPVTYVCLMTEHILPY